MNIVQCNTQCNTISRSKTGWDVLDFNTSFSAMKQGEFGQSDVSGSEDKKKKKESKNEQPCEKLRLVSMEIAFVVSGKAPPLITALEIYHFFLQLVFLELDI